MVRVPPYAESGNEQCTSYSRNDIKSQREERALGTSQDSSDRTRYIRSLLIPGMVEQEKRLPTFLSHMVVDDQQLLDKNIQREIRRLKRSPQRVPNPSYKDNDETLDPNQRFDLSGSTRPPGQSDPMDPSTFFGGPTTPSENPNRRNGSPYRNRFSNPSDLRYPDRLYGTRSGDQSSNPSDQEDPSDPTRPVSSTPNYRNQDRLHDGSSSDNQFSNPSNQRATADTTRPVSSTPRYRNQDRPRDSSFGDQSSNPQSRNDGEAPSRFNLRVPPSSGTSGSGDPYDRNQSRNGANKYSSPSDLNDTDNNRYRNPSGTVSYDEARWKQDPIKFHRPSTDRNPNDTADDGRVKYDRNTQNGSTDDRNSQNLNTGDGNLQRNPDDTRNFRGNNGDDRNFQGNGVGDRDGGGPRTYPGFDGGRRTYRGNDGGPRPSADEEDSSTDGPTDQSNLRGGTPGSKLTPEDVYSDIMILMYIRKYFDILIEIVNFK